MSVAPVPDEIYDRAKSEGERRLSMPPVEKMSTGFIAGITIVFGIIALGIVQALLEPTFGVGPAKIGGALAFGIGLVFLVVGRTELFSENFFDPVAAAIDRNRSSAWLRLGTLWGLILLFNLIGGAIMAAIFSVPGALPADAHEALVSVAEETADKSGLATFTRGVAAGALLTLLSFLLHAAETVVGRITLAYLVGFLVALGPLDHVVVTALHLLFGVWLGGDVSYGDIASNVLFAGLGNVAGGILLMTLTHVVQAISSRRSS